MKSLAVKYRPNSFDTVCGNDITIKILKRVVELNIPKNAYLFAGPSGCGKTTLARCFANALNKNVGEPIEIDAASNNGVDQVRDIIESASQRSLVGVYKIFIIDECHAITSAGWKAFLKGIEETPAYTIFIFCTTEPNKIPETILNRLQRFNISRSTPSEIKSRLISICQSEGFTNYEDTCDLISKFSNGCLREAINRLGQCADLSSDLCLTNSKAILGESPIERMLKLTYFLKEPNEAFALAAIDTLDYEGQDLKQFIDEYLNFVLECIKYILFKNVGFTSIPAYFETTADLSSMLTFITSATDGLSWLRTLADKLLELKNTIRYDTSSKTSISIVFLQICRGL